MTTWGVGAMPFNMQAKMEHDEDLALVIQANQAKYAKGTQRRLNGTQLEVCIK